MARFRLFGRPTSAADAPSPTPTPGRQRGGAPAPWGPAPALFGGPATEAARPAAVPSFGAPEPVDDPPTDPIGFPPIPPPRTGEAPTSFATAAFDTAPDPEPDAAEAASLACAFAADYLSWDEEDPQRRGSVLLDYLAAPGTDPAHLGWAGRGRQRSEFAVAGRVQPDGDGRLLVDVRVRVTPYRRVLSQPPAPPTAAEHEPAPEPEVAGIPAAAPAPIARGWRSTASYWIRLSVPVVADECGRLRIDAWEETLGEELEEPEPDAEEEPADDHSLADDEPVVGHPAGGVR